MRERRGEVKVACCCFFGVEVNKSDPAIGAITSNPHLYALEVGIQRISGSKSFEIRNVPELQQLFNSNIFLQVVPPEVWPSLARVILGKVHFWCE
jgi:hypothetical protein